MCYYIDTCLGIVDDTRSIGLVTWTIFPNDGYPPGAHVFFSRERVMEVSAIRLGEAVKRLTTWLSLSCTTSLRTVTIGCSADETIQLFLYWILLFSLKKLPWDVALFRHTIDHPPGF